jgi:endonuclease/exonuclease/phosphatase family metal-dependent hydrolase
MSNHKDMQASSLKPNLIGSKNESVREDYRIRVITYNIHSCVDKKRNVQIEKIAGIIDRLKADIVCLQEVDAQKPLSTNHN